MLACCVEDEIIAGRFDRSICIGERMKIQCFGCTKDEKQRTLNRIKWIALVHSKLHLIPSFNESTYHTSNRSDGFDAAAIAASSGSLVSSGRMSKMVLMSMVCISSSFTSFLPNPSLFAVNINPPNPA